MDTNRIDKRILLYAPQGRVWRALSDAKEFGAWFGAKFDAPFAPGANLRGVIKPTTVDTEVAGAQKPYENMPFEIHIEDMQPEHLFSFRWHPYAIERGTDYSSEPMTLVQFVLEPAHNAVLLVVTESGFDRVPSARRDKARAANEQGWTKQVHLIERYLADTPTAVTRDRSGFPT